MIVNVELASDQLGNQSCGPEMFVKAVVLGRTSEHLRELVTLLICESFWSSGMRLGMETFTSLFLIDPSPCASGLHVDLE